MAPPTISRYFALLLALLAFGALAAPAGAQDAPADEPPATEESDPWADPAADEWVDETDPGADPQEWVDPSDLEAFPPVTEDEPEVIEPPLVTTPTVAGRVAMLRTNGKAAIPRGAPARVRAIIAAANRIVGKPYKWGGGHAKVIDRGYDCSGTVGFALIGARLLAAPLVSGAFARWGASGTGRWVTIYANKGHVYMEVAGLRLDTSEAGDPRGGKGPRWRPATGKRRGFKIRHPLGL
jgi:cell wall-associated NlpC family hydrolase